MTSKVPRIIKVLPQNHPILLIALYIRVTQNVKEKFLDKTPAKRYKLCQLRGGY